MSDANLLVLFGTGLGMIGSLFLSIDALGAQDFLTSIDEEKERPFRMTYVGFLAIINNIFVYLAVSILGFIVLLIVSGNHIVFSMLFAPFIYFIWKGTIYLSNQIVRFVQKFRPRTVGVGEKSSCLSLLIRLAHTIVWAYHLQ